MLMDLYYKPMAMKEEPKYDTKCIVYDFDSLTARLSTVGEEKERDIPKLPYYGFIRGMRASTHPAGKVVLHKDILYETGEPRGWGTLIQGNRMFILQTKSIQGAPLTYYTTSLQTEFMDAGCRAVVRLSNHEVLLDYGILFTLDTKTGAIYKHRKQGIGLGYSKRYSQRVATAKPVKMDIQHWLRAKTLGTKLDMSEQYSYKDECSELASAFRESFAELGY